MLSDLIKLANFFDEKKMIREANVIDVFIVKTAQVNLEPDFNVAPKVSEPTWQEDEEDRSFESDPSIIEKSLGSVKLSNGAQINLEQHPLGLKIMTYLKNTFQIADSGVASDESNGLISVHDIDDIVQTAFQYTENLELYQGEGLNPNPMSPGEMRQLLFEAMRIFGGQYQTVGFLDNSEVRAGVHNLFEHYQDAYVDSYLNEDYQYNFQEPEQPIRNGLVRELTPEEREELWRKNDVKNLPNTYYPHDVDTDEFREKEKRRTPPSHRHLLYDR